MSNEDDNKEVAIYEAIVNEILRVAEGPGPLSTLRVLVVNLCLKTL